MLASLRSTRTRLHQACDRAAHLQDDGEGSEAQALLLEIEVLLQELHLDTNTMMAERARATGAGESAAALDLDSLLALPAEMGSSESSSPEETL